MPSKRIEDLVPIIMNIIEYQDLGLIPANIKEITGLAHTTCYRYCDKAELITQKRLQELDPTLAIKANLLKGKPFWI